MTAMSLAQCQDASTVTATEQQQWRGYKHNTCVKVPAEAKKKVKTEKQLKSLGGVFAFFKDREIEFLPLAKKFLNVSVFWVVFFFNGLTKKKKRKEK